MLAFGDGRNTRTAGQGICNREKGSAAVGERLMRIPALAILTTGTLSWLQSKTVCASQTCSLRNVIQLA
jgi:hypothetical protein